MTGTDPDRHSLEVREAALCRELWLRRAIPDSEDVRHIQEQLIEVRDRLVEVYRALPAAPADAARAQEIATHVHAGQKDKVGADYIGHPRRVAGHTDQSPDAVAAAWLHDVLEDGPFNDNEFRHGMAVIAQEVSPRVAVAVHLLTKTPRDSEDGLASYYERIRDDELALAVKAADIKDNTDPRRTRHLDPATRERLRIKYDLARRSLGIPEATLPPPGPPD